MRGPNRVTMIRRETYDDKLSSIVIAIYDQHAGGSLRSFREDLRRSVGEVMSDVFVSSSRDVYNQLRRKLPPDKLPPRGIQHVKAAKIWSSTQAEQETSAVADRIASRLYEAEDEEEQVEIEFSQHRAETLARTLVTQAITAGGEHARRVMEEAARKKFRTIWNVRDKELTCEICRPFHRKPKSVWSLHFPLGPPQPHPNCYCFLSYE